MKTFKHSGDVGDLIYALPTIRALGGGKLCLAKSDFTRVPMSSSTVFNIAPLLNSQPYIKKLAIWQGEQIDYDLDRWREGWDTRNNIAEQHLKTFGMPESELGNPWITVPDYDHRYRQSCPRVILNRTARHQNPLFPWKEILDAYSLDAAGFVGYREEHEAFEREFGPIPWLVTVNLLWVARAIACCKLFIGNQSTAYAIAEALKKPVIQEVYLPTPNCVFKRPDAQYVTGDKIDLPVVAC